MIAFESAGALPALSAWVLLTAQRASRLSRPVKTANELRKYSVPPPSVTKLAALTAGANVKPGSPAAGVSAVSNWNKLTDGARLTRSRLENAYTCAAWKPAGKKLNSLVVT